MKFNDSQLRAIAHTDGPMLVLAGPGSGKTTVILRRIENMIINKMIPPENILAVTFSRAAALELSERYNNLSSTVHDRSMWKNENISGIDLQTKNNHVCGSPQTDIYLQRPSVTFGTFHSIFLNILKEYDRGNLKIITSSEKYSFIRTELEKRGNIRGNINDLIQSFFLGISKIKSTYHLSASNDLNSYADQFSRPSCDIKTCNLPKKMVDGLEDEIFFELFNKYRAFLLKKHLIDFDDIIIKCHDLLKNNPLILSYWQKRFRYILVDEFQDISPMQYKVIKLLAGENANLFAVGDDDQSIYGFRGATPQSLRLFLNDYPDAQSVTLGVNYRSAPEIVHASLKVIEQNEDRFTKVITPVVHDLSGIFLSPFNISGHNDRRSEYEYVCASIKKLHSYFETDIAILFRNNSDYAFLTHMLSLHDIPFSSPKSSPGIFNHFAVLDILSYIKVALCLASGQKRSCREALLRIINKPERYISRDSLNKISCKAFAFPLQNGEFPAALLFDNIRLFYKGNERITREILALKAHLQFCAELSSISAIKYIRNVIGYDIYLKDLARNNYFDYENIAVILDILEEYSMTMPSLYQFITYCDHAANPQSYTENKMPSYDHAANPQSYTENRMPSYNDLVSAAGLSGSAKDRAHSMPPVKIMTMHSSKGMEFDTVFIPDANEGVIPNKRALKEGSKEEERRLFYVAMTRARKQLNISYVNRLHNKKAEPSEFLKVLL